MHICYYISFIWVIISAVIWCVQVTISIKALQLTLASVYYLAKTKVQRKRIQLPHLRSGGQILQETSSRKEGQEKVDSHHTGLFLPNVIESILYIKIEWCFIMDTDPFLRKHIDTNTMWHILKHLFEWISVNLLHVFLSRPACGSNKKEMLL